jgi:hypothetical protein
MESSTRMLAKTLTDLQVSFQLLQAAEEQQNNVVYDRSQAAKRSARGGLGASEEYLDILLGKSGEREIHRGGPANARQARAQLYNRVEYSLSVISERANQTVRSAVGGLAGLEAGELAQAAGTLGLNVAEFLGQAGRVSHLYDLFLSFTGKIHDALLALVGESLMQRAGQKVIEWVSEFKNGKYFPEILETLYQTDPTKGELKILIGDSQVTLEKYTSAIAAVDALKDGYGSQADLADKLLKGLKLMGGLPVPPQVKLILVAAYIVLTGYVVLAGADYVDSPQIRWLDRVVGVRRTVEAGLQTA